MAFISLVYGFLLDFVGWWARIDVFFAQLFGR